MPRVEWGGVGRNLITCLGRRFQKEILKAIGRMPRGNTAESRSLLCALHTDNSVRFQKPGLHSHTARDLAGWAKHSGRRVIVRSVLSYAGPGSDTLMKQNAVLLCFAAFKKSFQVNSVSASRFFENNILIRRWCTGGIILFYLLGVSWLGRTVSTRPKAFTNNDDFFEPLKTLNYEVAKHSSVQGTELQRNSSYSVLLFISFTYQVRVTLETVSTFGSNALLIHNKLFAPDIRF